MSGAVWQGLRSAMEHTETSSISTRVRKVVGLLIEAGPLQIPLGSRLNIRPASQEGREVPVELVGFSSDGIYLMPFANFQGIAPGDEVQFVTKSQQVFFSESMLGHVIDGEGELIDGTHVPRDEPVPIYREATPALSRRRISDPFYTGIKAWDAFTTMGRGQRVGIFAGTGVGKSVLLGMIARNCESDVNVLALIGERGNEVNDFIERVLGEEGMKKTLLVVATSDQTPLMRMRAAFVAASAAEYFASKGKNVLFLMDSITRMAMAARELGLSVGEPPTAKGYPPSVFNLMPRLLERAGNFQKGSITSIISVLLEGDDLQDPIGDAVRGILDGHVVLSRELAVRGQYPAIDVNESLSRWMNEVVDKEKLQMATQGRKILADYRDAEDLINVGAYVAGSNPSVDLAIAKIEELRSFMAQGIDEHFSHEDIEKHLTEVLGS